MREERPWGIVTAALTAVALAVHSEKFITELLRKVFSGDFSVRQDIGSIAGVAGFIGAALIIWRSTPRVAALLIPSVPSEPFPLHAALSAAFAAAGVFLLAGSTEPVTASIPELISPPLALRFPEEAAHLRKAEVAELIGLGLKMTGAIVLIVKRGRFATSVMARGNTLPV